MSIVLRRTPLWSCLHKSLSSIGATVDKQEIENFEKITDEWWSQFGPTKGLHSLNKLRVPFVRDGLVNEGAVSKEYLNTSAPLKGLSILDVGCGGGILSESLSRLGANVTGIDANSRIIDVAKKHAEKNCLQINYCSTAIEDHSQQYNGCYDAVVASEIVEHVTEKDKFVEACARCLKPCGSIFITTINKTFWANLLAVYVTENILEVVPRGTHQVEKFIAPHKLQRLLEDNNIRAKLIHGMVYNIVTNRWSWCSNISINYALHGVKLK